MVVASGRLQRPLIKPDFLPVAHRTIRYQHILGLHISGSDCTIKHHMFQIYFHLFPNVHGTRHGSSTHHIAAPSDFPGISDRFSRVQCLFSSLTEINDNAEHAYEVCPPPSTTFHIQSPLLQAKHPCSGTASRLISVQQCELTYLSETFLGSLCGTGTTKDQNQSA